MNTNNFVFDFSQFNKIFPFYLLINKEGNIESFGNSMGKLAAIKQGDLFAKQFSIIRPTVPEYTYQTLSGLINQLITITFFDDPQVVFRGQLEPVMDGKLVFLGSPWFESVNDMVKRKLTLQDFSIHDPLIDLLHILQNQESSNFELKQLLSTINQQKKALLRDQELLRRKENMLLAIAEATDEFLTNSDFFDAVYKSLQILGVATGADRVYLFENHCDENENLVTSQRIEWNSGTATPQIDNPDLQNVPITILGDFLDSLLSKEHINVIVSQLNDSDFKQVLQQQDIKSLLLIPVVYSGKFWGFVGYDNCQQEELWSESEVASLKSFSNSISNALLRSEMTKQIRNMALFATENPDPVLRVGLRGEVILKNDAAKHIDYYILGNIRYNEEDFFQFLSSKIDDNYPFLNIEISHEDKVYDVVARLSGSRNYINVYANDITEKKVTENLLIESEKRTSTILHNIQTGVILEDEDRKIKLVNKKFISLFNFSINWEDFEGQNGDFLLKQIADLFVDREKFLADVDFALKNRNILYFTHIDLKDGRIYEWGYIPIFISDIYKGHLWKFFDITDWKNNELNLKKQEEKYRSIIENMNLGLLQVNLKDEVLYANHTFAKQSGYSVEELLNKKATELFVGKNGLEDAKRVQKSRKRGISDSYELYVKNKNGEKRWWLVSGAPEYDDKGTLIGSIGIHLDITDRKKLEQELEISKRKAEESSNAKEVFLTTMSHEIRTPLNGILGMVRELSKVQGLPEDQKSLIANAGFAGQHLLSLLNNILDISKIEAGEFHLESRDFSIPDLLDEIRSIILPISRMKKINLNFSFSGNVAPAHIGDPSRIRQILLNIIGNAVKFTEEGSVTVQCKVFEQKGNIQTITFIIIDTGIGMDSDFKKKIFKKFVQEHVTYVSKYEGTGLGMAISYQLVQLMKGNISVESEKDKGSTFQVTLDLPIGDGNIIGNNQSSSINVNYIDKKALLVEDNELNREIVKYTLSRHGFEVFEAENGKIAIEILQREKFDVILMDVHMPEMGGVEAATIIRKELQLDTPIIALTANAFKNQIEKCKNSGMNDYVTKPYEEEVLVNTINKYLVQGLDNSQSIDSYLELDNKPSSDIEQNNTINNSEKLYNYKLIFAGDEFDYNFLKRMVLIFVRDTPASLDDAMLAFKRGEFNKVRSIIHRIKPSVLSMGILSVKEELLYLEKVDENTSLTDVKENLDKLERVLSQVIISLKEEFGLDEKVLTS
jgi:PAS domain S-box-containing protein